MNRPARFEVRRAARVSEGTAVRACPLCSGTRNRTLRRIEVRHLGIEGWFRLRQCRDCELVFVTPRLCDERLARLYGEEFYFHSESLVSAIAAGVQEQIQEARRQVVEKRVGVGRLLDLGSGDGTFVHHMASHGWDATGVDFSPAARELALRRRLRGRFLLGSLANDELAGEAFDAVTLWQVLEHIGEPLRVLRRVRDVLRPGGLLVASVPNIDGLSAVLTQERWWGLDVPRHLVHYTPRTLRHAVRAAGLTVVDVRHFSLQYDPYALFHSTLDWAFTQRHFLSDLAKAQVAGRMGPLEYGYNLAALAVLTPMLAPLSLVTSTVGACFRRGGFIEIIARRD
jgi:2-polyprenyl-3-methyl-5-hydroxy-6-metoxy-1,4-benzoquinol methylase